MQDSSLNKSSSDAPSDQGAARFEDFSILKPLRPFAAAPVAGVELSGAIERTAALSFRFAFQLSGNLSALSLPSFQTASLRLQKDELWKSTCFEIFVGREGHESYLEMNFAPSGDFAIYSFHRYRDGMTKITPNTPPLLSVARSIECYTFSGCIDLPETNSCAREVSRSTHLDASITAVLKPSLASEPTQYWALAHAGEKADFHLRESFLSKLDKFKLK